MQLSSLSFLLYLLGGELAERLVFGVEVESIITIVHAVYSN